MIYIGVDIGLDGALVALDDDGHCVGQSRMRDLAPAGWQPSTGQAICEWLSRMPCLPSRALVETPSTRPDEGRTSALTTGIGYGVVIGALSAASSRVTVQSIAPQTWRATLGLPVRGSDRRGAKRDAVERAQQIPGLDLTPGRVRVPHTGLADAACIALVAMIAARRRAP